MKYTKFVALLLEEDDQETGFLAAAQHLHEEGMLEKEVHKILLQNLLWIEEHLPKRPDFPQNQNEPSSPMSWLKDTSTQHLKAMQNIQEILEQNDILVEVLEVDNPGKIIYEDEWQIVAMPFMR